MYIIFYLCKMTDAKKVQITSVSSSKGEKKEHKRKRTVRLIITLPESNEKFCPEFNYGDLLSQHLSRRLGNKNVGEVLNGPQREPGDPYASDEDEALKALARQLEQKYGSSGAGGNQRRRKRKKENDFKQLGEGYDETDPFIDNSDAVDDVLPTNVETKHGGFYINSGELNFEEVQVSEDDKTNDSEVQTLKRKRKNDISSSSEEEEGMSGGDQEKDENKVRENGILKPKKRKLDEKLDEGEMLRRRKKMIDKFNARKHTKQPEKDEGTQESETEAAKVSDNQEEGKTANETSIAASIEAVVNAARESVIISRTDPQEEKDEKKVDKKTEEEEEEEEKEEESSSASSTSSSSSPESSSSESDSDDEKEEEKEKEDLNDGAVTPIDSENDRLDGAGTEKDSSLPSNLPADLITALDRIKEVGRKSKASSQKFFTEPVNKMLLSVELKLCKYRTKTKNQIYNHLSLHLPCGTQTLIKRGKNLLAEKLDERLRAPIKKLKEALDVMMPPLVESHALECQKIAEKKGENSQKTEGGNAPSETNKKLKLPKKKFDFTPELRNLLCAVVKIRCQAWHLIKKRSETPEEHVKNFIDSHLKGFWPKGWITTKVLYNESQDAHQFITSKNSSKVVAGKKLTVLGGGTVSNPVSSDSIKGVASAPTLPLDDLRKGTLPLEDQQLQPAPENIQQIVTVNGKKMLEEPPPKGIEKQPAEKDKLRNGDSESVIKMTSPKGIITPQKVLGDLQVLSSTSPVSESSTKSFHGFESPSKPAEIVKNSDACSAKQALFIDPARKNLKGSESSDPLLLMREGKPPKPSLTATALPKHPVTNSVSGSKSDQMQKSQNAPSEPQKSQSDDKKISTCISVKSVDKINEDLKPEKMLMTFNVLKEKRLERTATFEPSMEKRPEKIAFESLKEKPVEDIPAFELPREKRPEKFPIFEPSKEKRQEKNPAFERSKEKRPEKFPTFELSKETRPEKISTFDIPKEKSPEKFPTFEPSKEKRPEKISTFEPSTEKKIGNFPTFESTKEKRPEKIGPFQHSKEKSTEKFPNFEPSKEKRQEKNPTFELSKEKPPENFSTVEYSKEIRSPFKESSKLDDNVRVIDLSSDEEVVRMSTPQKREIAVSPNTSIVSIQNSTPESVKSCSSSFTTPDKDCFAKHNKLEMEMDYVMNELIQISKKNLKSSKDNPGIKPNHGAQMDGKNNSRTIHSLDKDAIHRSTVSPQTTMRQSFQLYPRSNVKLPSGSVNPCDLSVKSSPTQSVLPSKPSPYSVDSSDQKSRTFHPSLQKQSSSERSFPSKSQVSPAQLGSAAVHSQSHYTGAQDTNQSRSLSNRVSQNAYQSSQNLSHGATANESYSKAPAMPTINSSTAQTVQRGLQRSSSNQTSTQSIGSGNQMQRVNHSSGQMSTTQTAISKLPSPSIVGSHNSSPSSQGGSLRTSSQTGSQRSSPYSQSGSQGSLSLSQNSSFRTSLPDYSGNKRSSPSIHTGSQSSSSLSGNSKTPSSNPSSSQRASSAHTGSRSSGSSHPLHPSSHRFSSERNSVERISSSPKPAHLPVSSSHGPSSDSDKSHPRGFNHPQKPAMGLSYVTSRSSLQDSGGSKFGGSSSGSSTSRSPKPSHNIEGLLYSSSSKGPEISAKASALDLRHSKYSHELHSSQHREPRTQPKYSSNSSSWAQESLSNRSSSGVKTHSGISKASEKESSNNSYVITGNGSEHLANLRQMEGLSIRNVQKKTSQSAYPSSSSRSTISSSSSSQKNSSSAQPKVKHRSDSISTPVSSNTYVANLSPEQQEFWQQVNSGGYIPGISHGYKYLSQQGHNQSSNSTGNSRKKPNQ